MHNSIQHVVSGEFPIPYVSYGGYLPYNMINAKLSCHIDQSMERVGLQWKWELA